MSPFETSIPTRRPPSIEADLPDDLSDWMRETESILQNGLIHPAVPFIETVCCHLVQNGGKRIRPQLVLLSAHAMRSSQKAPPFSSEERERVCRLAAVVELIHTATLLHDDVIDEAHERRHAPSVNAQWNNSTAILTGDYLYSRAFQWMVQAQHWPVLESLAHASNQIAEGELLQLLHAHDWHLEETTYWDIIGKKTACLFQAATSIGALLGHSKGSWSEDSTHLHQALADFGYDLGLAFQIIDDVLDYRADPELIGKPSLHDLREGRITLPLLRAMQHPDTRSAVEDLLTGWFKTSSPKPPFVIHPPLHEPRISEPYRLLQDLLVQNGILEDCMAAAEDHIRCALKALSVLPTDSPYRKALVRIAEDAASRLA